MNKIERTKEGYIKLVDFIMSDDREYSEKLKNDLIKKCKNNVTQIAVVDQIIKKSDGSVMYKPLGTNVSTLGGTQTIVENLFDNLDYDKGSTLSLTTLDDVARENAPSENWNLTEVTDIDKTKPRKIFGFMLGTDGAIMTTVKTVARRDHNIDLRSIIPFNKTHIRSDQDTAEARMHVPDVLPNNVDNYRTLLRSIDAGKYAGRFTHSENGDESTGYVGYLIKLLNFTPSNILVDGTSLSAGNLSTNPNLDVRSKVEMIISAEESQLSAPAVSGGNVVDHSIKNTLISSIMLVAGRKGNVNVNGQTVTTYGDIIVTNRINFIELPVEVINLNYRYTIYFV